jgi:C-terminal processing protease CtpA/Prc
MRRTLLLMMLWAALPLEAQLQNVQIQFGNMQAGGQAGAVPGAAGIGAILLTRNGAPVISQLLPHSPAAGAGLKSQDTIVWVNYRDVAGMKLEDVVKLIRGPTGSSVAITVLHPGDPAPHTYTMTRAPIVIGP